MLRRVAPAVARAAQSSNPDHARALCSHDRLGLCLSVRRLTETEDLKVIKRREGSRCFTYSAPRRASPVELDKSEELVMSQRQGMTSFLVPTFSEGDREASELTTEADDVIHMLDEELASTLCSKDHQLTKFTDLRSFLGQLRHGQIVGPMTRIYNTALPYMLGTATRKNDKLDPILINNVLRALSRTATASSSFYINTKQRIKGEGNWKPSQLPGSVQLETVPVHTLCVHALATVYDIAHTLNVPLSPASTAWLLRALSFHLDLDSFSQCLTLVLLQLSGVPFHEAQQRAEQQRMSFRDFDASMIPVVIVSAIIDSMGVQGKPEFGEDFLRWWASNQTVEEGEISVATHSPMRQGRPGESIAAEIWLRRTDVWTALVRARAKNGELLEAKHWLEQYRKLSPSDAKKNPDPYFEFLRACSVGSRLSVDLIDPTFWEMYGDARGLRFASMREVLSYILEDEVYLDDKLFSLLINIEIGYKNLTHAASLIQRAFHNFDVSEFTPSICKALFRLHKRYFVQEGGLGNVFDGCEEHNKLRKERLLRYGRYHDVRALFQHAAHTFGPLPNEKRLYTAGLSGLLKEGILCAVTMGDLPLALAMLGFSRNLKVPYDSSNEHNLISWLTQCYDGHGGTYTPSDASPLDEVEFRCIRARQMLKDRLAIFEQDNTEQSTDAAKKGSAWTERLVRSKLVGTIRCALKYDLERRQECSKWVQDACRSLEGRDDWSDEEIVRSTLQEILNYRTGKRARPILSLLL